jgi:capsular exopolysaccharide synthesis family protein
MSEPHPPGPVPAQSYGTNLVDRINVAIRFSRYFKLIVRRWPILFVCTALGLGYSLYKVYDTPVLFDAVAEVEITPKLQLSAGGGAVVLEAMNEFYDNQLRLLGGGALQARVLSMIRNSNNPRLEPPSTRASASRGQGSAFHLTVRSPDLEYARLYASNWAQAFLQHKHDQLRQLVESKKFAFHQDIIRQEASLKEAREASDRYSKQHQLGSASDTYKAAQQQLDQLKSELAQIQTQRKVLEQTSKEDLANGALLGSRSAASPRDTVQTPAGPSGDTSDPLSKFTQDSTYVTLRSQLNDQTLQLSSWTNILKPKHPEMARLSRQIEQLNQRIAFQLKITEERRQATVQSLALKEAGLFAQIKDLAKQVLDLRGVQDESARLKQEENRLELAVASLKNTLQQIDLTTTDDAQFSLVGDISASRVDPQKQRTILQGVAAGFALGLALIYFLNRLDDRLELAEDIEEELEEPVLGQIPQVDLRSVKEGYLLVTKLDRHNMFAESIRGVRSAIMLGSYQGRKQALLISSAVPGDGKTTFTVNFAATLAIAGSRVLLVDADLRRGNIHTFFDRPREPGLTEILSGQMHWSDAAQDTEIKTLRTITSGQLPPHPGELLVSPVMAQFVEAARREFDYIIMDCPPLTAIDDAFCLIGLIDGLLFVVRSGQTSMRFAKTALAAVRQRGANTLGIVLNGITADNPYYYYNYYYHAYYHRPEPAGQPGVEAAAAKQMASPKARSHARRSIQGEAMVISGQQPSARQIRKEAAAKADMFKARRAAHKLGGFAGPGTAEPDPAASRPLPVGTGAKAPLQPP